MGCAGPHKCQGGERGVVTEDGRMEEAAWLLLFNSVNYIKGDIVYLQYLFHIRHTVLLIFRLGLIFFWSSGQV